MKTRTLTCFAAAALFGALAAGCSDDGNDGPSASFDASPRSLTFDASASQAVFRLSAPGQWSIVSSDTWIASVNPSQGGAAADTEIAVSVEANGDTSDRTATLTITCEGNTLTVGITQFGGQNTERFASVRIMRARLSEDPDGFNMLSNPGFEDYPEKEITYNTPWYAVDSRYTNDAHGGAHACAIDYAVDNWGDLCVQTVPLLRNTDYVETAWYKSSVDDERTNIFLGMRRILPDGSTPVLKDAPQIISTSWNRAAVEWNSGDDYRAHMFSGAWAWVGLGVAIDDVKIVPKGVEQDSYLLSDCSAVADISAGGSVRSADGCVVWNDGQGGLMMAFGPADVEGAGKVGNAVAVSTDGDPSDGLTYTVVADGGKPVEFASVRGSETACVPTAGIAAASRQYIHYMRVLDRNYGDNAWTVGGSGLAYSDDGGKTWSQSDMKWAADGNFVQAAFEKRDGYVYMYGTPAGREGTQVCVARAAEGDMLSASAWQYWNGAEWKSGDEKAATGVTFGTAGEVSVMYNTAAGRWMMLYYSPNRGAVVFRDARAPQGEWSGEKLLLTDGGEGLFAPSFHPVSAGGQDVYFLLSSAWGK